MMCLKTHSLTIQITIFANRSVSTGQWLEKIHILAVPASAGGGGAGTEMVASASTAAAGAACSGGMGVVFLDTRLPWH